MDIPDKTVGLEFGIFRKLTSDTAKYVFVIVFALVLVVGLLVFWILYYRGYCCCNCKKRREANGEAPDTQRTITSNALEPSRGHACAIRAAQGCACIQTASATSEIKEKDLELGIPNPASSNLTLATTTGCSLDVVAS